MHLKVKLLKNRLTRKESATRKTVFQQNWYILRKKKKNKTENVYSAEEKRGDVLDKEMLESGLCCFPWVQQPSNTANRPRLFLQTPLYEARPDFKPVDGAEMP